MARLKVGLKEIYLVEMWVGYKASMLVVETAAWKAAETEQMKGYYLAVVRAASLALKTVVVTASPRVG